MLVTVKSTSKMSTIAPRPRPASHVEQSLKWLAEFLIPIVSNGNQHRGHRLKLHLWRYGLHRVKPAPRAALRDSRITTIVGRRNPVQSTRIFPQLRGDQGATARAVFTAEAGPHAP